MIINNSYEDAFDGKYKDYIACEGRDRKLLMFDTYEDFSTIFKQNIQSHILKQIALFVI